MAPLPPAERSSSCRIESAAVRWSPMLVRRELFDQVWSSGPRLVPAPRSDITSTASTRLGSPSSSTSSLAPTSPRFEPSIDASTSVFLEGRPWNTRASSSSAAVADALPGASGTVAASRPATTAT